MMQVALEMDYGRVLQNKRKKRKYLSAYLSGYYVDTDFGNAKEADSLWKINEVNVTKALRRFRQVSMEGAQQRKYLLDSRVLSLSYIFLFSSANNCVLSKLLPDEQKVIMKSLNAKEHLNPVNNEVMNACQQTHSILNNEEMTMDKAEEAIDEIKSASQNKSVKIA